MKLNELLKVFEHQEEGRDSMIFRIVSPTGGIEGSASAVRSFCPHLLDAEVERAHTNEMFPDILSVYVSR